MASVSLVRSLNASLRQCDHETQDGAAVALAKRYAAAIEAAAEYAAELDRLQPEDEGMAAAMVRLRAAFDAQSVLSDLGPRFLAVLGSLNMTPTARNAKGGAPVVSAASSTLAELRAKRAVTR